MTDFEILSKVDEHKEEWFERLIAPETITMERPAQNASHLVLVGLMAAGISSSAENFYPRNVEHWEGSSTSVCVSDQLRHLSNLIEQAPLANPVQQLTVVQTRFGLTKVGLAKACRVERQTIYDWYKEKFPPMGKNALRLNALYRIADDAQLRGVPTLNPRRSGRPLSTGRTLPKLLSDEILDQIAIRSALDELAQLENTVQKRSAQSIRERLGWKEPSEEQQAANLEHNLDDLG